MDQSSSRMAQLKRRVESAVRLVQAGLPGRILGRLIEVSFLDRTVILAGQAFSAILPLIMVVNIVSPHPGGDSPAAAPARRLGLGPRDVASLQSAIAPPPSARASIGILGVAFTLFSWLSVCAFVIVVATVIGAVPAEDPAGSVGSSAPRGAEVSGQRIRHDCARRGKLLDAVLHPLRVMSIAP